MNEAGQWFLGVVQALEKRLRLAWILTLAFGPLLLVDRFWRAEVDLGGIGRPTVQIVFALAVATILVVSTIYLVPRCWRGLREFIHESLDPFEEELRQDEERKQREWDRMYAKAEAENRDIDQMFQLNRWLPRLPNLALMYLVSILKHEQEEIWAWDDDAMIQVLIERGFLEEDGHRYGHQQRYLVPNRTKAVLESRREAFKDLFREVGENPWDRRPSRYV